MKKTTTSLKMKSLLTLGISLIIGAYMNAQVTYCSPTFPNGCTTWNNQTIMLDSINWTIGSTACTVSDYTAMRTTLIKGVLDSMHVTSGNYTGVGVWIDFDNNGTFDSTENMYHKYIAGPGGLETYNFAFTVPLTAPTGTFRMRVIAGWGSDCYSTTSMNGYGGCGTYMWGNYDDFTVQIVPHPSGAGINVLENTDVISLNVSPNPVNDFANVRINGKRAANATITLTDIAGKEIQTKRVVTDYETIDLSALAKGMYFLTYTDSMNKRVVKVQK